MIPYLDTSAFVAWFDPHNPHCRPVLAWREKHSGLTPAYNRMLQLEARHYLRRLTHSNAGLAWNAFRAFLKTRTGRETTLPMPLRWGW